MIQLKMKKPISFILTILMTLSGGTVFSGASENVQTFIDMPAGWSQNAMEAAVKNGLLYGTDTAEGKALMPEKQLTRAEMAALISRAFGAETANSLSGVKDVPEDAWYAGAISTAVEMGAFALDSYMRPQDSITRQEAFTVLARAMKLDSESAYLSELEGFNDGSTVADWARNSVSVFIHEGYIAGSGGAIHPENKITRAEFAQVMNQTLKQYISTPGTYSEVAEGNLMVNTAGVILKDLTVSGDLIAGEGVGNGDLTLENVTVEGRFVVRGGGLNTIHINGNSKVEKLIIAKIDGNVRVLNESGDAVDIVYIDDGDDTVILSGNFGSVSVESGIPVSFVKAEVGTVAIEGASKVTLDSDSEVKTLSIGSGAGGAEIMNQGRITSLKSDVSDLSVTGTGTVASKTIAGETETASPATGGHSHSNGGDDEDPVAPPNPISMESVLDLAGVPYDFSGDTLQIGANDELLMEAGSTAATFDGIACTLDYTPTLSGTSILIDPAFFADFFGATYSNAGEVVLPDYAKELLTGNYASKLDIYQSEAAEEDAFLAAIDPQTGWDFALELGNIGSAENGLGFRTGGTVEGEEAAQLVYDKFEELGYTPVKDYFNTYAWRYLDSSLTVSAGGIETTIPAISAVGTKGTDLSGISGEIVDIGKATKQDFVSLENAGIDLTGKIALIAVDLDYQPWQSQACYSAEQHGAAGVIYYCHNYYGQYTDGANGQTAFNVQDWSGPEIDIPVLNVPKKYGLELKASAAAGTVEANLVSKVEIVENSTTGTNVYAVIEGSKYPDEYVMVNAHTDAYFTGFQDDSIAIGAMIAFAEAITNGAIQPDRSIILLATSGEEFGAMDIGPDWLVGSWSLMENCEEAQSWVGKIVSSLTLELMAYEGAEGFEMRACDTLYEYIKKTAEGFTYRGHDADSDISGFNGLSVMKNEVSNMSDEFTMVRYGVPTFRTNTHSQVVSKIYHSQFDSPETTSYGKYSDCLDYYGSYLIRMAETTAEPYDLTLTADKYETAVDFDYLSSLGYDDTLAEVSAEYQDNARENYLKNALILKLAAKAATQGEDISAVESVLADYNGKVRETLATIIEGTTRLAGETVTLEVPFYITMHKTLSNGIASLEAGQGPASEVIFRALPGRYYTNYLEYDAWYSVNRDNINLGSRDILWGNDVKLQYLDIYDFYQNLKTKGDGEDFTSEIETASAWLSGEAAPHLQQAVSDNVAMFEDANASLSAANEKADEVISALEAICGE